MKINNRLTEGIRTVLNAIGDGLKSIGEHASTTPAKRSQGTWTLLDSINAGLAPSGYTTLAQCPEVIMAVDKIADLISNMAIHLMENIDGGGDRRIINGLSRLLDIEPCPGMTRKSWMQFIVRTLLLEGDGNALVIPVYTADGLIEALVPVPARDFRIVTDPDFTKGYRIQIADKEYKPDSLVHFVLSPDPDLLWKGRGYRVPLKPLADLMKSGQNVKKEFMNGRYMPSVILKVDTDVEEINSEEGKQKLLGKYLKSNQVGEPWVIPSETMDVAQLTPLSLKDIAVTDAVAQDRKAIAALLGVPAFMLGEGEFNQEEYNNFIKDKILSVAKVIEQTLTKELLVKDEWHFQFNIRSLYSNDLNSLAQIGDNLYSHGIMTGNEVRNWMGLSPMDGLNELTILENYIPASDIGNQNKLNGGGENEQ